MLSFVTGVQEYGTKLRCDIADLEAVLMSPTSYCTPNYRDRPPHREATAVKRTQGCHTTPALVIANYQILSVARLRENANPAVNLSDVCGKETHV